MEGKVVEASIVEDDIIGNAFNIIADKVLDVMIMTNPITPLAPWIVDSS